MGGCCSKDGGELRRSELSNPLLADPSLGADSRVLVVHLLRCRGLPAADTATGTSDPYVVFRVLPEVVAGKNQRQNSSIKASTLNPTWEPSERFDFLVNEPAHARLIISVFDHDLGGRDDHLGDAMLRVQPIWDAAAAAAAAAAGSGGAESGPPVRGSVGSRPAEPITLALVDGTGSSTSAEIDLAVEIVSLKRSQDVHEDFIYEYQRWRIDTGWSHDNLLPTDPGNWSDLSGRHFGAKFDDVAPPLKPGFVISVPWSFSTTSGGGDPEAWGYAVDFRHFGWNDTRSSLHSVRRRIWRRISYAQ
jgi:hypothetical protein